MPIYIHDKLMCGYKSQQNSVCFVYLPKSATLLNMRDFSRALIAFSVLTAAAAASIHQVEGYGKRCPKDDSSGITVHLPHERDCTLFYKCHQGKKVLMRCPPYNDGLGHQYLLHFNSELEVCDYPWEAGCKGSWCPKDSRGHVILEPHETDCTMYYDCEQGMRDLRKCPSGEEFHRKKLKCVPKWESDCGEKDHHLCPPTGTSRHPDEKNCDRYIECKDGVAITKICPNGACFNSNIDACETDKNIGCAPGVPNIVYVYLPTS